MQVIKGAYGGRRTAIGYLRLCRVIRKRQLAEKAAVQNERLRSAVSTALEEISIMQKNAADSVGEEHGEIFGVYMKILSHDSLMRDISKFIADGIAPEDAIRSVFTDGSVPLQGEFSLGHIKEALDILSGVLADTEHPIVSRTTPDNCHPGDSYIYVSDGKGLMPILKSFSRGELDKTRIAGVICTSASELTLSVSLELPALLIDSSDLPGEEFEGVTAILDCRRKKLILDPDLPELERYSEMGRDLEKRSEKLEALIERPSVTLSGQKIFLNSELCYRQGTHSLSQLSTSCGDPSHLLLTDEIFCPGDDDVGCRELEDRILEIPGRIPTGNHRVTVRLQSFPLRAEREISSSLGLRGAGLFALFRPIYKAQIRALLRASCERSLSILLPSVGNEGELWQFRSLFREAKKELRDEGIPFSEPPGYGVELSTPSALLCANKLADGAGEVVIDLDRLVSLVSAAELFDPISEDQLRSGILPAIMLCGHAIDSLQDGSRRFGVRGTLAADPELTHSLIECGFSDFYLPPDHILAVKEKVLSFGDR